ncbi:uncharacterized protein Z519_04617 [Cladophialophora bantiana CBS 173.52]|uniref:Uncharacterized protein n=1 Tax=Cladophialophora bantiana (strain ATCC 10958 / CBS 173.52 / CDC B-1940 / NIH 8579) TaxID=1442370 RepID=A0A0D2EXH8_CLAB1|nr:uncharacterized protein Z519_04617 [Cladophialophora bantiana CBS 173.52]KIW94641.1 hypothetical protein Z519_04617 [Cladophialophora bantiana CBS 173.52]
MKRSTRTNLPLAVLFIAAAKAQTSTVINDPADTGATTVYYSVCPTALTTTTTLSSTITFCPGPNCNGGGPVITPPPTSPRGTEILSYTTTLPNGDVEEIHEYLTVYHQICSNGQSIGQATYTITEACPCEATTNPTSIPEGFTTTVVSCDVCHNGGATTMTITTPCSTGPYATQTPVIGPTGGANAQAQAAASAEANVEAAAGSGAGAGSSSESSGSSGSSGSSDTGSGSANANANANSEASSGNSAGGANSASSANSAASASSGGSGAAVNANANAAANAAASAEAGINSGNKYTNGTGSNGTISPPITPVAPGSASQFTGSADKMGHAISSVFAFAMGCLAFML